MQTPILPTPEETNESLSWTDSKQGPPIWSRLRRRNHSKNYRNLPISKYHNFNIEVDDCIWSLWGGNKHLSDSSFLKQTRNRQYLACCVMACCTASIYPLLQWSHQLLDTIVDLNLNCSLENFNFVVHIEHVAYGKFYQVSSRRTAMNLSKALNYFFSLFEFGILQVPSMRRALAFGLQPHSTGGYFMYDCQSKDQPLFRKDQGVSYLLRTRHLQNLLYCIVVTLNVPCENVEFTLHKVEIVPKDTKGETTEEETDDETEDKAKNKTKGKAEDKAENKAEDN